MVRGCPLDLILNSRNVSPTDHHRNSASFQSQNPPTSSPQSDDQSNKFASYRVHGPVLLSSKRGALYTRRASPQRNPVSSAAHDRDQPIFWDDGDPPSKESDLEKFCIFNAILGHPDITYEFARCLEYEGLLSLYSISRDFHNFMNKRFTAMILAQALSKAPESSRAFPFRCYGTLCQDDLIAHGSKKKEVEARRVPTFRWLRFILFREKVVDEIVDCLAAKGHRLPKLASLAIKKIWFLMDVGDGLRRLAVLQARHLWSNRELYLATMFFIKLDMRLTDPVHGNGEILLRKMLLGQGSLLVLWRVLKRQEMLTQLDMIRMHARWDHAILPQHRGMRVLGVPATELGRGVYEGFGVGDKRLLGLDELVMRETVSRKLNFNEYYLDMMLWGHVDNSTLNDIWPKQRIGQEDEEDLTEVSDESDEEADVDYDEGLGSIDLGSLNLAD